MADITRDWLAELLALTDTDPWRNGDTGDQADFVAAMADQEGNTFQASLDVTITTDVATWAAHEGVTAVPEAGDTFAETVDPERIADLLNSMGLPDGVGFNVSLRSVALVKHGQQAPDADGLMAGCGTITAATELLEQLVTWREETDAREAKGKLPTSAQDDARLTIDRELAALVPDLVALLIRGARQ